MTASNYLPERLTGESLREAAKVCHGCDLWRNATQTVFGEGPAKADLMFVGEQPDAEYTGFVADLQQVVALL